LLALAVNAYQAKHGTWPTGLDELEVKGLDELRKDPFSDKDFVYQLKGGKPLLYCVGADGKDDGGRHDWKWGESGDGDYVFWPHQKRN
jgi:hypothetical protein